MEQQKILYQLYASLLDVLDAIDHYVQQGFADPNFRDNPVQLIIYKDIVEAYKYIVKQIIEIENLRDRFEYLVGYIHLKNISDQPIQIIEVEIFIDHTIKEYLDGRTFLLHLSRALSDDFKLVDPDTKPGPKTIDIKSIFPSNNKSNTNVLLNNIIDVPKNEKQTQHDNSIIKKGNAWEQIPDKLWDRKALKLWWEGHTNSEISKIVFVTKERVTNRLSELRQKYGEKVVPKKDAVRKYLISKN